MEEEGPAENRLLPHVAMAALLGKYLGEAIFTFAFKDSGLRANVSPDTVVALRESSSEASKLLVERLALSQPALASVTALLSELPRISSSEAAVAAESAVVRIGAELRALEGTLAMTAFLASYELRRVRVAAKAGAHNDTVDLVRFFGRGATKAYLLESIRLLAQYLETLYPKSRPYRYLSLWCARADERLKDGAAIKKLCVYLNSELIDWFALHVEYMVPDPAKAGLDAQFFLRVFDLGRFASAAFDACLVSRQIRPKTLYTDFYALSTLASRLAVRQPELEEAEFVVARATAKYRPRRGSLQELGKLVQRAVLFKAKTLVELQYGSMAHSSSESNGTSPRDPPSVSGLIGRPTTGSSGELQSKCCRSNRRG